MLGDLSSEKAVLVTKEQRGARKEGPVDQEEVVQMIDRAEMIAVVLKRKKIAEGMTTGEEAQKRSEETQDLAEADAMTEVETEETGPTGLMQPAELSWRDRSSCQHYRKPRLQRCGQESH